MTRGDNRAGTEAGLVRRALGGHAAIGLLAGALLYIVCLTGALVVIHDQLTRWEQPGVPEMTRLSPDAAQAAVAAALTPAKGGKVAAFLTLQMPTDDLPRAVVTAAEGSRYLDTAGRPGPAKQDGWTSFVVLLHETLTLPTTWGLILVGALGVALTAVSLTGVVAHPRILRDAFRLRLRHAPQIARVDWHNRLGVWTLPFVLVVAVTGAFLGTGSIGAGVMARAYAGGRVDRIYNAVFGPPPVTDAAPAPLPDVAAALRTLAARVPAATPTYIFVRNPATRGQDIEIVASHPRRLIYGETYLFDARGRWRGAVGLAAGATGQQVAASTYNLHFGNYGGMAVELAYLALGLGLCVVIATGTSIWLHKRRVRGLDDARLTACWAAVVWGTPLALLACAAARGVAGAHAPFAAIFWGALAALLALATVLPARVDPPRLRRAALASLAGAAALHLALSRPVTPVAAIIDFAVLAFALPALAAFRNRELKPGAPPVIYRPLWKPSQQRHPPRRAGVRASSAPTPRSPRRWGCSGRRAMKARRWRS